MPVPGNPTTPDASALSTLPPLDDAPDAANQQPTVAAGTSAPAFTTATTDNRYLGVTATAAAWIANHPRISKGYAELRSETAKAVETVSTLISNASPVVSTAISYITRHARGLNDYGGECAEHVREGLEAAGIHISLQERPAFAYQYASLLPKKGCADVTAGWTPATARPGDIVVFDRTSNHRDGHVQIYAGDGKWYSDCEQKNFLPNQHGFKGYHVFRMPGANGIQATTIVASNDKAASAQSNAPTPPAIGHRGNYRKMAPRYNETPGHTGHGHATHLASAGETPQRRHSGLGPRGMGHGPAMG